MLWREVISKSSSYLAAKGVPDAQVAAELLAARLLKIGRGFLAPHFEKDVSEPHLAAMRRALARLIAGEPLQYVLGEWDFRSLTLKCDRRALIPRPETEELVTRVLKFLVSRFGFQVPQLTTHNPQPITHNPQPATHNPQPATHNPQLTTHPLVIDVGTGTGAIVLSLAKEFAGPATFLGTDVSEDAIALAKENAAACGLAERVTFAAMDGLDDFDEPQCVDAIVSNPPYIESAVCETLDPRVKNFEPRLALDGGANGLDFYDRYLADAFNLLKPGGAVFFEIGENQGDALRELMAGYGFSDIRVEPDFAGHDRYASATLA